MQDQYKVSVRYSRLPLPLWLFAHTYIVTEHNGVSTRYDLIGFGPGENVPKYDGYIYKDILPSETGFLIFFLMSMMVSPADGIGPRWQTKLCSTTTGPENSPAHRLYDFIETGGLKGYLNKSNYNMVLGPNSNTFVQWVIDQVPECELELPWNAWGKGYERNH